MGVGADQPFGRARAAPRLKTLTLSCISAFPACPCSHQPTAARKRSPAPSGVRTTNSNLFCNTLTQRKAKAERTNAEGNANSTHVNFLGFSNTKTEMRSTQRQSAPFSTSTSNLSAQTRPFGGGLGSLLRGRRVGGTAAEKCKAGLGCQKISPPSVVSRSAARSVDGRKPEAISPKPDSLRNIGEMSRYGTDSSSVSPQKHSSHHVALNWPVKRVRPPPPPGRFIRDKRLMSSTQRQRLSAETSHSDDSPWDAVAPVVPDKLAAHPPTKVNSPRRTREAAETSSVQYRTKPS